MIILSDDVETRTVPTVNSLLIISNLLIFFWMVVTVGLHNSSFIWLHGTVPARFIAVHDLTQFTCVLTSMFLHGGFLHVLGNMWMLYLFGDNVEDQLGHFNYLLFYLTCGFFADLGHIFSNADSVLPTIGASGAIAGVMGAYLVLHPTATCKTWWGDENLLFAFRTYRVPASLIIVGWFVLQIFVGLILPPEVSGIAFQAHVAGFTCGMLLLLVFDRDRHDGDGLALKSRHCLIVLLALLGIGALYWTRAMASDSDSLYSKIQQFAAHHKEESGTESATPAKRPAALPRKASGSSSGSRIGVHASSRSNSRSNWNSSSRSSSQSNSASARTHSGSSSAAHSGRSY
ncbi:MAG TPA: rhomboid family intramembrane serine protease [Chroococcales cyanobacterium]